MTHHGWSIICQLLKCWNDPNHYNLAQNFVSEKYWNGMYCHACSWALVLGNWCRWGFAKFNLYQILYYDYYSCASLIDDSLCKCDEPTIATIPSQYLLCRQHHLPQLEAELASKAICVLCDENVSLTSTSAQTQAFNLSPFPTTTKIKLYTRTHWSATHWESSEFA